jgi:hypothetical protein
MVDRLQEWLRNHRNELMVIVVAEVMSTVTIELARALLGLLPA